VAFSFDNQEIELPCPKCSRKTKKSIGWIKRNKQMSCACGAVINLQSSDMQRELRRLESQINNLFK